MRIEEIDLDARINASRVAETDTEAEDLDAIETDAVILPEESLVGESTDDLEARAEEIEEVDEERREADERVEALEHYMAHIETLIATNKCSMESLQLIQLGVSPWMVEGTMKAVSLESAEVDIVKEHELALEGIKESIKTYLHGQAVLSAAIHDSFKELFTATKNRVGEYTERLTKSEANFKALLEKPEFAAGKDFYVDLHALNNFFSTVRNGAGQLRSEAARDLKFSQYILTVFAAQLLSQVEKAVSIFSAGGTLTSAADKLQKLKTPVELFDARFATRPGEHYFDQQAVVIKRAKRHGNVGHRLMNHVLGEGEASLERLHTVMNKWDVIEERSSFGHKFQKYAKTTASGSVSDVRSSHVLEVTRGDVEMIFKMGHEYLGYVKVHLEILERFDKAYLKLAEVYEGFEFDPEEKNAPRTLADIYRYFDTLSHAFTMPCGVELRRALRGARYCGYFGNRTTYVNSPSLLLGTKAKK